MKAPFVFPLIALAAGLAWIGYQHHRLETLTRDEAAMRQRTGFAQQRHDRAEEETEAAVPAYGSKAWKAALKGEHIGWDRLAELIGNEASLMTRTRLEVILKKKFTAMTTAGIEEEYDRMQAMELPAAGRRLLRKALIEELAERDPGWVVQHPDPDDSGPLSWQIQSAFMNWVSKDLPGAMEWMDRQIAAGGFDRKALDGGNDHWADFEYHVFPRLYETDPAAAFARLQKLPQELRAGALRDVFYRLEPSQWEAYMESARAALPASGYEEILAGAANDVSGKGVERMDALITATHASPEEREQMAGIMVMDEFSRASDRLPDSARIDELYAWGMKQAPGRIALSMGAALGGSRGDFQARAELALHYAQQGDGDALLAAFLKSSMPSSEVAAPVLERISDETLRAEVQMMLSIPFPEPDETLPSLPR